MQQDLLKKSILIFAVLSTIVVACKRDIEADINSPAYHIYESDKLIIPAAIDLPANMPDGNTLVITLFAEGVQKYRAQQKAGSNPATLEWVFIAPEANLYDATNAKVGTHSAGPAWQLTGSTDSIYGQQFSPPKSAPGSDPATIDWLLLVPKIGKPPTGVFSKVSYIQRIATKGGKAPDRLPVIAGETIDVKYTAV